MDRRTTIKWVLSAAAAWPLLRHRVAQGEALLPGGYGSDPDLTVNHKPGEPWPLSLTAPQRRLAGLLCDIIMPADDRSPAASAVGVVDFIDEWVSAPYPDFQRDRGVVLGGLVWLDEESARRFGRDFSQLDSAAQHAVCDDICDAARAPDALRDAAKFFALFRDLTAGAYYSTATGRKDLGYVGNVPLQSFEGPPTALLMSLGLA
jgi:hypothetical protein